jgi:hypothetical protein
VPDTDAQGGDEAPAASELGTSQDLWDGVEAGEDPAQAPALDEPAAEDGELVGAGQNLAVAAGLLGTGLVLLTGGVLVAAVRRRPATAAGPAQDR